MKTIMAVASLALLFAVAIVLAVAIRAFVAIAALWGTTDESN